ncbi:MAG TPA: DUF3817 domain-containing protein [Pseudonocardiaceae bacterium]|nr:DUF3817 domain-containing protein [Pseudonocardiaceae bacterium]
MVIYRVAAYTTGVMLLVLTTYVVLQLMELGHLLPSGYSQRLRWSGIVHGWLYVGYLIATFSLGMSVRWRPARIMLVALAGTIPLMSFVAERSVTREMRDTKAGAS